jgi:hypothetical protein
VNRVEEVEMVARWVVRAGKLEGLKEYEMGSGIEGDGSEQEGDGRGLEVRATDMEEARRVSNGEQ